MPGPRRPVVAALIASISSAAASRISAASAGVSGSKCRVFLFPGRLVLLAQAIQPGLPLLRGHRILVQPGGITVPPGVRRNRLWRHERIRSVVLSLFEHDSGYLS